MRPRHTLSSAARALAGFLRGFLGLPGSPGCVPAAAAADAPAARRALEERSARRGTCC
jgi:uncharacterized membrane protein YfcA